MPNLMYSPLITRLRAPILTSPFARLETRQTVTSPQAAPVSTPAPVSAPVTSQPVVSQQTVSTPTAAPAQVFTYSPPSDITSGGGQTIPSGSGQDYMTLFQQAAAQDSRTPPTTAPAPVAGMSNQNMLLLGGAALALILLMKRKR